MIMQLILWHVDPLIGNDREISNYTTALKTMAVARQWLSSDHVGTPTDTNTSVEQQQRSGIFCAVRAEM
jgi:stage V sporulation protein SpoVS